MCDESVLTNEEMDTPIDSMSTDDSTGHVGSEIHRPTDSDEQNHDIDDEEVQTPAPTVTRTKRSRQKPANLFQEGPCDEKAVPSTVGGKRKAVISVSLLDFVHLVQRIAVDTTMRRRSVDDNIIAPYLEELRTGGAGGDSTKPITHKLDTSGVKPSKRMKSAPVFLPTESTTAVSLAEARSNEAFEKHSPKSKRTVYFGVISALFVALERANANLQFSREHLKYFLATHQRAVTVSDFADTNRLKNGGGSGTPKKQKSPARLNHGAILVEYAKAPGTFPGNLTRCEPTEVEAVRFVVEVGMSLSHTLYRNLIWRLDDVQYTVDKVEQQRVDHVRIPIANCKRTAVLITESVVLVYDGTQFTLPAPNVERDFTATMIASARLKRKEHMVLDTLMAPKLKVIDIIATTKENFVIPPEYSERLRLISETLVGVKTVSMDEVTGSSYIEKSIHDHTAPVYVYYKPNHTVAAIGVRDHNVWLAYRDDDGDLVYKLNTPNAGPASLALGVVPLQPPQDAPGPQTILYIDDDGTNTKVNILGLENEPNVRLFSRAVCVELKDGNKLGSLSGNAVSNVREYKTPAAPKDAQNISVNNLTSFFDDTKNFDTIMKALNKSTQFDRFLRMLKSETTNLTALDLGY